MKKVLLAALVAVFVLAMTSTAFASVVLTQTGLNGTVQEEVERNFSVKLTKGATDATDTVRVKITVTNDDGVVPADADVEYWETLDSSWHTLPLSVVDANNVETWFGPVGGFPLTYDPYATGGATSNFRVTFADGSAGSYYVKIEVIRLSDDAVRATLGATVVVVDSSRASVIGDEGASAWTYQDLSDASPKYEGGYKSFDNTTTDMYTTNPHGGYDTTTNKCKVCHAVHRAEGAYYLLRADSQDDACDYCHVGGSAHSAKVVYDIGGTTTANGHTIGAQTQIPDSSVRQWTEEVTLATTDANGDPLTEDIHVRAYDSDKNAMYRFARHHGHSIATGTARRNYIPVGPLALRCMNCHQVHNAEYQTWSSISMASMGNAGEYTATATASYKLLKQSPSGTFTGGVDSYGQIPIENVSIVPETTLTAGTNFDSVRAPGDEPGALTLTRSSGNMVMNRPMWVAQNFDGEHDRNEELAEEAIAAAVNNAALSVWCADCHNLNIGGWEHLTETELGFKAHTERTHPAPYTGSHSGPGQCYSCHRADLPRINGRTPSGGSIAGATVDSCSQCHYGTGNYKENRTAGIEFVASDFPHGADGSYKMLGNYSITRADGTSGTDSGNTTINYSKTITSDNLDAVCIRCHGGIGKYH